jgi:hypothetical protein
MAMTDKDYTNKKIADANKKTKLIQEALKKKLPVKKYLEDNTNKSNAIVVTNKLSKKEAVKSPNIKTVNNNKGQGNSNTDISKGSILTKMRKNVGGLNLNAVEVNTDSSKKIAKVADKKSKTSASASNTKDFASTMARQKKLKAMGANITADGIMGPKTRAAMAKYMKAPVPKSKPKGTLTSKFGGEKITAKQRLKEIDDEKKNTKRKSYFSNLASSLKKKSKAKG